MARNCKKQSQALAKTAVWFKQQQGVMMLYLTFLGGVGRRLNKSSDASIYSMKAIGMEGTGT